MLKGDAVWNVGPDPGAGSGPNLLYPGPIGLGPTRLPGLMECSALVYPRKFGKTMVYFSHFPWFYVRIHAIGRFNFTGPKDQTSCPSIHI